MVRFRVNGRTAEKPYKTLAAARAEKVRIEVEALDGSVVDPRAGARDARRLLHFVAVKPPTEGAPADAGHQLGYERLYRRNIASELGAASSALSARRWCVHGTPR